MIRSRSAISGTLSRLPAADADGAPGVFPPAASPVNVAPPATLSQAQRLVQQGRRAEAEEAYRALMAWNPSDARVFLEAGLLADERGDTGLAVTRLRRAYELDGGEHHWTAVALGRVLMHHGRTAAAGRHWWNLVRRGIMPDQSLAGLVICAHAAGHHRLARHALSRLTSRTDLRQRRRLLASRWCDLAATPPETRGIRAKADRSLTPLQTLLRHSRATLRRATRHWTRRADLHYHLAACHAATDQIHSARRALRQALTINPRYEAARRALQDLSPAASLNDASDPLLRAA
jgi:tetratricopeptide (TPR) repeat protein